MRFMKHAPTYAGYGLCPSTGRGPRQRPTNMYESTTENDNYKRHNYSNQNPTKRVNGRYTAVAILYFVLFACTVCVFGFSLTAYVYRSSTTSGRQRFILYRDRKEWNDQNQSFSFLETTEERDSQNKKQNAAIHTFPGLFTLWFSYDDIIPCESKLSTKESKRVLSLLLFVCLFVFVFGRATL